MKNDNRHRILDLIGILYNQTDDQHCITTEQISDQLEELGYDRPNRKTVEQNIRFLIDEVNLDIEKVRSSSNQYRWLSREFELAELKLLADAVLSSRFISLSSSKTIIEKLKKLCSDYDAKQLDRDIINGSTFKRDNPTIIYNIDTINTSLSSKKMIKFQIADYDLRMKEVLRHDGKIYEVSPLGLIWNNDYYYMIGIAGGETNIRSFRVDRMRNIEMTDKKSEPVPANFKIEHYSSQVFDMYTGRAAEIELLCQDGMMNYLVDRLGKDVKVTKSNDDGSFTAKIVVEAGPTFYAWIFQFGGLIKITGPDWVKAEFNEKLEQFK